MEFRVDPRGRCWWPGREDLSIEFTTLLGAAQEGGSTVAECCLVARRIDPTDDHSWYREWKRVADLSYERGNAARAAGHLSTARSNWLRAIGYYQSAVFLLDSDDADREAAIASMRGCAREYLEHRAPRGEVVTIQRPDGYPLEAYFLPAPQAAGRPAPTILCIGEPGRRKEEFLYKNARHAADRGMSLLAADVFGPGREAPVDQVAGRADLEATIGCLMDHLVERSDVDRTRVAILADSWGSSFVARGIAFDDRYAAAVCDGGIWDLHERGFLMWRTPVEAGFVRDGYSRVAQSIRCPVLITTGERGWLKAERVHELYDRLKADRRDVTLKMFTSDETAALQGHVDNPTLANEHIFDWIAERLGTGG
jgi:dienelactone hydrolase